MKLLSIMENLKKIDFIGHQPEIYYFSKSRHKTYLGALLTLITFGMSGVLTFYFIIRVFLRNNMIVVQSSEFDDRGVIDFNGLQIPILITNQFGNLYSIEEEDRMFNFKLEWYQLIEDGSFDQINKFYYLKRCDKNKDFPKAFEIYKDLPLIERHYCIQLEELDEEQKTFIGFYGSKNVFSGNLITVDLCINGENNKTNCLPEEEIRDTLAEMYAQISFPDYNVQNSNIDSPAAQYLRTERLPLSTSLFKRFFYPIVPISYKTDFGYIFEVVRETTFFKISPFSLQPSDAYNTSFAGFTFHGSSNRTTIVRSFEKVQEVLSNIGGSIKALVLMSTIINMFFNGNAYNERIVNELFTPTLRKDNANKIDRTNLSNTQSKIANNFMKTDLRFTKKQAVHKVNFLNNLKMRFCIKKGLNMDNWNEALSIIKRYTSIDFMIKKMAEVERLKLLIMDKNCLPMFDYFYPLTLNKKDNIWQTDKTQSTPERAIEAATGLKNMDRNFVEERLYAFFVSHGLIN